MSSSLQSILLTRCTNSHIVPLQVTGFERSGMFEAHTIHRFGSHKPQNCDLEEGYAVARLVGWVANNTSKHLPG